MICKKKKKNKARNRVTENGSFGSSKQSVGEGFIEGRPPPDWMPRSHGTPMGCEDGMPSSRAPREARQHVAKNSAPRYKEVDFMCVAQGV